MTKRQGITTDESASLSTNSIAGPSKMVAPTEEFTMVPTREEKRKQRKMEKQRPQFQYDTTWFRAGKKVGIAVSVVLNA